MNQNYNIHSKSIFLSALLSFAFVFSCTGEQMAVNQAITSAKRTISEAEWKKAVSKKVFFGHQSVGFNILDGVKILLKSNPNIKINIVQSAEPSALDKEGIWAHSTIGRNENPTSKIDDFIEKIENGIGHKSDIVFMKFCYLDITHDTDEKALFHAYKQAFKRLSAKYPKLKIAHVTVPLTKRQIGIKALVKKLIGKPLTGTTDNVKRDSFNSLLKKEFSGKDPIFDLAEAESAYVGGARETHTDNGRTYPALIPDYTYDGGHLNDVGKVKMAEQFILFLANLQ
jgi:hypothetical protein